MLISALYVFLFIDLTDMQLYKDVKKYRNTVFDEITRTLDVGSTRDQQWG